MTHKERIIAALKGEPCDRLPWAPRMDLWYIANHSKGTLPPGFEGLNTAEIAKKLGVACHAVRADYTLPRPKESLALRGFGLENHPDFPYRLELNKLPVEFKVEGEEMFTRIETPVGEVTTHLQASSEMLKDGISIPFVKSYPIETKEDFEAVGAVFENLEVIPTPENYRAFRDRVGDDGLAVAHGQPVASPIHLMLHDMIAMDKFYYMYMDYRKEIHELAERMAPFFNAVLDAVLQCDAEALMWGANYDQDLTYPPFYEEEIAPWLTNVIDRAHAVGKTVVCHCDGENEKLLPLYRKYPFDMAESVCPHPMTHLTLKELREGIPDITIWGGIPAITLMHNMSEVDFRDYLDTLFAELGSGRRLILGVADNVPPAAILSRFEEIQERIEAFGAIGS